MNQLNLHPNEKLTFTNWFLKSETHMFSDLVSDPTRECDDKTNKVAWNPCKMFLRLEI